MWIWFFSCSLFDGPSIIDVPPSETPSAPAPRETHAWPLGRRSVPGRFVLPPSSRPGGEAAPGRFTLLGPLELHASKKHADIYKAPLPVLDNLLPSEAGGTHSFGSDEPPGFVVSGPKGRLEFERGGKDPNSYGFDRQWLYIGLKKGSPPPDPDAYFIGFEKATETENGLNLATSGLSPEAFAQRSVTVGVESWSGLYLPPPASAEFDLTLPKDSRLTFRPRILSPAISSRARSDGAGIEIALRKQGQPEVVIERVAAPADGAAQVTVDLSAHEGPVTLILRTTPGESGDNTYDYLLLEAPTVYQHQDNPKRILLVFVDTLRADHLGLMGYPRPTTPILDRLAKHAAVFTNARTVAPWTLPSARAAFTGAQPEAWYDSETLAEAFGAAGWRTEALVSNAFLSQPFDLHRGWDHYDYEHLLPASDLSDRAVALVEEHKDRDLLLLVHFMDPHLPYDEPFTYWHTFTGSAPKSLDFMGRVSLGELDPDHPEYEAIKTYVTGRYDQNILYVDHELRAMFDAVGQQGTIVVFSDHGEELWDHGGYEHGHTFYDELLRVPFIIRSPHVVPGRYDAPISLLDLAPTVRDIGGIPPAAAELPGRALAPLTFGDQALDSELRARPLAFGRPLYGVEGWGVVSEGHKWWDRAGVQALYDLAQDPGEQNDIARRAQDLDRWPAELESALGRKSEHAWRIALTTTEWMHDLELTISHPDGIARAWIGYDPRGRHGAELVLSEGRVSLHIDKGAKAPSSIYVVPSGDPYEPKGLAVTLVGRGVMLGATATRGRLAAGNDPQTIVATGDDRFHILADLAWVPEPSGVEVSGFHPDLERQLEQLGYLGEEKR